MTLKVGDNLPPFRLDHVDPEGMKVWAKALRDPNPIHLDPAVCKAMGLGERVINQGPANLSYLINMLVLAFPGGKIESLAVRYADNVFGGEAVEATGTVTAIDEAGRVSCEISLRAADREAVVSGTATVLPGKKG